MAQWKIPVTWSVSSFVYIEKPTLEEAMETVGDESNDIPLPSDPDYIDGSWELSHTDVEEVRQCYNNNQKDYISSS